MAGRSGRGVVRLRPRRQRGRCVVRRGRPPRAAGRPGKTQAHPDLPERSVADERVYPLTIDLATGVYLRSEGERILFGLDAHADDGFTEGIDWRWLEQVLLTGVERYPWWEDLGVDRQGSWWGYYGVTPDTSPVIGFNPGTRGWVDACGFSGHGIMHSPATGLAVSELVADGRSHTLDVTAFRHERFADPQAEAEVNIF